MMKTLEKPLDVVLGGRHVVKAQQQGTVPLRMKLSGNEIRKCNLQDVLYVQNIMQLNKCIKICQSRKNIIWQIKSTNGELTTIASRIRSLYYLNGYDCRKDCMNITTQSNSQDLWHR